MRPWLDRLDHAIVSWMNRYGHASHRIALGLLFVWMGLLKQFGLPTTTSLLAHTVYWGDPEVMVLVLGWWEVAIGVCFVFRRLGRVALFLLAVRLPGTILALVVHPEISWVRFPFAPTPEGQYLLKDIVAFTAALVIGGTVRRVEVAHVHH